MESGEVEIDEDEKRLEFEGTLYILHLQDFFSRIVPRHVVLQAIEHGKRKKMEQASSRKSTRGYELSEHSLISEAEFTSARARILWLLFLPLTLYVITTNSHDVQPIRLPLNESAQHRERYYLHHYLLFNNPRI